jgi:uncharacterized protein (TIGR02594 family)
MKKLMIVLASGIAFSCMGIVSDASAKPTNKEYHNSKSKKHKVSKQNRKVNKTKVAKVNGSTICVVPDRHTDSCLQYGNAVATNVTGKKMPSPLAKTFSVASNLGSQARSYMGKTARDLGLPKTLWCADFMNMLVGGSDRRAISYLRRGTPAPYGCTDCVAVTRRRGGQHVGIVTGYDDAGNPILVSGNHNRVVGEGVYPKRIVLGYRYM